MQRQDQRDHNNSVRAPAHEPEYQFPRAGPFCFGVNELWFFEWRNVWSHNALRHNRRRNDYTRDPRNRALRATLALEHTPGKQTMITQTRIRHLPIWNGRAIPENRFQV